MVANGVDELDGGCAIPGPTPFCFAHGRGGIIFRSVGRAVRAFGLAEATRHVTMRRVHRSTPMCIRAALDARLIFHTVVLVPCLGESARISTVLPQ